MNGKSLYPSNGLALVTCLEKKSCLLFTSAGDTKIVFTCTNTVKRMTTVVAAMKSFFL